MDNKLISTIIVLFVGIVLTGSLLAPVVSDAASPTVTTYYNGSAEITYTVEHTPTDHTFADAGDGKVTIDGTEYDFTGLSASRAFTTESVYLHPTNGYVCIDGVVNESLVEGWTATFTDGIFSIVNGDNTRTSTHTDTWDVIFAGTGGTHVVADTSTGKYVTGIDDVIWVKNATTALVYGVYNGEGWFHAGSEVNCSYTLTPVSGTDLYTVTGATVRDGQNTITNAYVPISVSYSEPKDYAPLMIAIIPIILAGLVIGAVGLTYVRNKD